MANGYIGKISAIVTANTSDLSRKLSGAVGDVDKFANRLNASVGRAASTAGASLEKIFTPLQRLERQFSTALKLNLRTEDEVRKIQQLVSVAEQINRPLEKASGSFSKLSAEVQGAFLPALNRAQTAVVNLSNTLQQQGSVSERSFRQVESVVDRTTQAIQRLTQAQQLASQSFTGNELQFENPQLFQSLSAGADLTRRAAALPASQLADGDIARQVRQLQQFQNAAVEAAARVSSLRLDPQVNVDELLAAERRLDSLVETTRRAQEQLGRVVNRDSNAEATRRVEDAENASLVRREQARKALDQQLADGAKQRADAEVAALAKREQASLRLERQLAAATKQREDAEIASLVKREQAALNLDRQLASSAKQRADEEIAALTKREQTALRLERQLAADAKQRQQAEISTLTQREQSALRLERQLASDAEQRQQSEISTLAQREQAALRLERQIAADASQRQQSEITALTQREQAALRLERQLAADAAQRQQAEITTLTQREQAALRLERQLAAAADQRQQAEISALTQREQAALRLERQLGEAAEQRAQAEEQAFQAFIRRQQAARNLESQLQESNPRLGDSSPLAGNRNPRQRVLDDLGGEIDVLRRRVGGLAEPLRETVGPAVDALTTRFQNLARAGVGFTAEEARRLSREVANVNAALASRRDIGNTFRESFGGAGAAGISLGVDERSLRAIGSQIEFVQGRLSGLAQEARGPVIAALEALRVRAADLFDGGALDTAEGRRELQLLREELIRLLSAAGAGSERRVRELLNRAGDVGRRGADTAALALQQAAFAVDDFFSVTGGFEQRIRAVGNNLTQLGFIVGGTTGLFIALGVSLGAQAVAGIVRFINNGQAAEDQTKSLNDALERQKTLADQLAQSFFKLADAIATRGFSAASKQARDFSRELESLIKLQRDAREERLVSANPRGQEIDNRINSLNRRLRDTTDPGQGAAIQDQIGALREERRQLRQNLPNRPAPTRNEVANSIGFRGFQSTAALAEGVFLDTLGIVASLGVNRLTADPNTTRTRVGADAARAAGAIDPSDTAAIRRAIDARIQEINPLASRDVGFVSTINGENRNILAAREERARLQELRARFEDSSFDDALGQYVESINAAGAGLEAAQNEVTKAIEAGVPGARALGVIVNRLSQQIDNANGAINKAIDEFNANPTAPGAAERRDAAIAEQQRVVDRTRARRAAVEAESDRLRFTRTVDPQSTVNNRMARATQNLSDAGVESGQIARRLREIEFQRETLRQTADARPNDPLTQRLVQQSEDALGKQVQELLAASAALRRFTEALNAAAQEAAANLSSAQQEADAARRAQLGFDTPRNQARRAQADRDLEEQRQANARVEDTVATERARLEEQALSGRGPLAGVFAEIEAINEELLAGNASAERQAELIAERRRLEERINSEIEQNNAVIAARDDSTRIAERQGSARRGEELSLTPAERAAEEMARGVADINAYFDQMSQNIIDANNGLPDANAMKQLRENERKRQEAQQRFEADQERAIAPMIFDMMDAAANVLAQGPRREALGAVDASTLEGQRELNRLIRGDDPAKDINVIELRKQTKLLTEIRDKKVPIAN